MSKLLPEEQLAMSLYRKRWNGQLGELTVDEFLEALMKLDYLSPEHHKFIASHEAYDLACEEYRAIIKPAVHRAFKILEQRKNNGNITN